MISVVTVCLNAEKTIKGTLASVQAQKNKSYEHIIKDGISSDASLALIYSCKSEITKVFSYADDGIYDAFNQSLNHCTGEYVNFLGAGDYYVNERILNIVECEIKRTNCDLLYGDLNIFKSQGDLHYLHRKWKAGEFKDWKLRFGWMPPHPTVFVRKSLFSQIGNFNEGFAVSGDYDWLLRVLKLKSLKVCYLDFPLVNMEYGGVSQKMVKKSFIEDSMIGVYQGNILLPIFKRFLKINQFKFMKKEIL